MIFPELLSHPRVELEPRLYEKTWLDYALNSMFAGAQDLHGLGSRDYLD